VSSFWGHQSCTEVLWSPVVDWWKRNHRPKGCLLHYYGGWFLSVVSDDLKLNLDYYLDLGYIFCLILVLSYRQELRNLS
jgi:hypothetical protein